MTPTNPNVEHVTDAKSALGQISDHETAVVVAHHVLNVAKANGVSREEILDAIEKVFYEPDAAPVEPAAAPDRTPNIPA